MKHKKLSLFMFALLATSVMFTVPAIKSHASDATSVTVETQANTESTSTYSATIDHIEINDTYDGYTGIVPVGATEELSFIYEMDSDDNLIASIPVTADMLPGYDSQKIGKQQFSFTYKGFPVTVTINVRPMYFEVMDEQFITLNGEIVLNSFCSITDKETGQRYGGASILWWDYVKSPWDLVDNTKEGTQEIKLQVRENGTIIEGYMKVTVKGNGQWMKSGSKWWYRYSDGSYPKDRLCQIGNAWYGFDADGWMQTGWTYRDNRWYYFNASGVMQTGWQKIGSKWYYFDETGAMQIGWRQLGGSWYYFDYDGMSTGWLDIHDGAWYYLASDGKMTTGWQKIGNSWYYFASNGKMATGWLNINGSWYYLTSSGKMATGWQKIGGAWYYLTSSGKMATGWLKLGNTWYYLNANGKMATNTWIGNSYVNGSGAWVRSR